MRSISFQIYHKQSCPGAVGELICDYCNETGFDSVNILSVHVRVRLGAKISSRPSNKKPKGLDISGGTSSILMVEFIQCLALH